MKKYEVTLFILGLPYHESRTRKEIIEASTQEEAEQKAHDWYAPDGWGVYDSKEVNMKKKFNVAITLPLTLWVEVEAENDDEAIEKAKEIALKTPYEEWGDDFSTAEADIVEE